MLIDERSPSRTRRRAASCRSSRDVSLTLERGHAAAIMGPSGSGKSTLLYILGALDRRPPEPSRSTAQDPYTLDESASGRLSQRAHRLRVPGSFAAAAMLGARERADPDARRAPATRRPARTRRARERSWRRSASGAGSIIGLASSRAARSSARRWRARSSATRRCSSATSQPAISIASIADAVADLLLDLHAAHKTILVVVTHSAALADRFPARYDMADRRAGRRLTCRSSGSPREARPTTGAPTSPSCSALARRCRCSVARCSSGILCAAVFATSRSDDSGKADQALVIRADSSATRWRTNSGPGSPLPRR